MRLTPTIASLRFPFISQFLRHYMLSCVVLDTDLFFVSVAFQLA